MCLRLIQKAHRHYDLRLYLGLSVRIRFANHKQMGRGHRVGCITRARGCSMVVVGVEAGKRRGARAIKMRRSADFYLRSVDSMPCQWDVRMPITALLDVLCVPVLSSMLSRHILCSLLCPIRSDVLHDRISIVRRSWTMLCHCLSHLLVYRMHAFSSSYSTAAFEFCSLFAYFV